VPADTNDGFEPTRTVVADRKGRVGGNSVRITVTAGPDVGASAVVSQRRVIIGRAQGADFRLTDPQVSAFHCEVSAVEHGMQVQDLNSRNGTTYSGARLDRAVIPPGRTLEVGESLLRLDSDQAFDTPIQDLPAFGELRGRSVYMRELFSALARLARTELSVLIEGATGTGKELAARAAHDASPRAAGPFVVLDCTAIPATLAESVLFGHERGAFTGASERRIGIFEAAEGGTVFIDEVGELPLELQPKLLRVLERREVVRVGSTSPRPINVRVICATWRDLRAMINQSKFREDLYYRIAQARVSLIPLRERPEDISLLVYHFLQKLPAHLPGARQISAEALEDLTRREYPGNVRELKSVVERAAMMAEDETITPADLAFERILVGERERATGAGLQASVTIPPPPPGAAPGPLTPFKEAKRTLIDEFERDYLQRLLARTNGNLSRAAAIAGIERHYLRDLFRKHGLRSEDG